jgi:hypothetical protein
MLPISAASAVDAVSRDYWIKRLHQSITRPYDDLLDQKPFITASKMIEKGKVLLPWGIKLAFYETMVQVRHISQPR